MPVQDNTSYLGVVGGKHHFKFRQSTLKNLDMCPARVKFEEAHPEECWESDAAAIGTAVHTGIESYLTGETTTLAGMVGFMENDFLAATQGERFKWIRWAGGPQSEGAAIGFGNSCLTHWFDKYESAFENTLTLLVEHHFDLPFYEDDERVIRLSGTMDLIEVDPNSDDDREWMELRPWDWKTSGRGEYQVWEYARWAIQPTVYSWACAEMWPNCELLDFTYAVMHAKGVQQFSVERGPQDWKFLERKVVDYAKMIERDAWHVNDAHALCSDKWCPAWDVCKGKSC